MIATEVWTGDAAGTVVLAHATGFCSSVWRPVVDELRNRGFGQSVLAWDAPGHGRTPPVGGDADWWAYSRAVGDVVPDDATVGVGHSMGGAMVAMLALEHPEMFRHLILIEPIVFPPPHRRMEDNPLATLALRRRSSFPSPEAARANYASKRPFSTWDPRALDGYLACGLRQEGDHWVLACSPEVESDTYRAATMHDLYERLPELGVPVTLLAGAETDTYPIDYARSLADRLPDARFEIVSGVGHFLPMERPDVVAASIAATLA